MPGSKNRTPVPVPVPRRRTTKRRPSPLAFPDLRSPDARFAVAKGAPEAERFERLGAFLFDDYPDAFDLSNPLASLELTCDALGEMARSARTGRHLATVVKLGEGEDLCVTFARPRCNDCPLFHMRRTVNLIVTAAREAGNV